MYRYSRVGVGVTKTRLTSSLNCICSLRTPNRQWMCYNPKIHIRIQSRSTRLVRKQIWNAWMCVTKLQCKRTAIFEGKGSLTTARFLYQRVLDFALVRYCSAAPNTRRNTTYLTCSLVNDHNDSTHHVTPYSVFFCNFQLLPL